MLQPNTILQNRYRIVRQLGRGGMGAVYEAIDLRLSRTVALKETIVETQELRKAFEREARLLANLNHSSLPRVTDHFNEGMGQYLVMDYIPGDDLKTSLQKRGAFSVDEVLRWADELLEALDYLHSNEPPIIHRDIKPSNLKLSAKGRIMLLDFGLAKGRAGEMSLATISQSILGHSPHFAPLEQIEGNKTNPRSDLYALGATLYNLLTNRLPPDALTRATAMLNDEADPLLNPSEINPEVPAFVSSVLMQALALKPAQRPASALEMRSKMATNPSLLHLAQPDNNLDEETVLGQPRAKAQKSKRLRWLVSGAAALLAVLGFMIYYNFRPSSDDLADFTNVSTAPAAGSSGSTATNGANPTLNAASQIATIAANTNENVTADVSPTPTATPDLSGTYHNGSDRLIIRNADAKGFTFFITLQSHGAGEIDGSAFWTKRNVAVAKIKKEGFEYDPNFPSKAYCRLTFVFSGTKAKVAENDCLYFHGVSTNFEGSYTKK